MTRPLAWAGFTALLILLAAPSLPPKALLPLAAVLLAAAVALYFLTRKKKRLAAALVCAAAGFSLLRFSLFWQTEAVGVRRWNDGTVHRFSAVVCETGNGLYTGVQSARLRVTAVDEEGCRAFHLVGSALAECEPGDVLVVDAELEEVPQALRAARWAEGVFLQIGEVKTQSTVGTQGGAVLLLSGLRRRLGAELQALGSEAGGVAAAMTVGDRSHIASAVSELFARAGVAHVLVVSGLHLSLLGLALGVLFRLLCGRRRRLATLLTMAGIFAFMLLMGMTVSVVRAGVLLLMVQAAGLLRRRADTLNSLGFALLLILTVQPCAALDRGLWLSFLSTLGLMAFSALDGRLLHLSARLRFRPAVAAARAVGTAVFAILFTLPVLALSGTTVSPACLLCNLVLVPLVGPVMLLGWLFLFCSALPWSFLADGAAALLRLFLRFFLALVRACAASTFARVGVTGLTAAVILCAAGLTAFVLFNSRLKRVSLLAGAAVLFVLGGASALLNAGTVRVALVGAGADAPVVISRDGECALLYRGRQSGLDEVETYLSDRGLVLSGPVIDLGGGSADGELCRRFGRLDFFAESGILYSKTFSCLDGLLLTAIRQKEGCLCVVDVDGFRIGVSGGAVDCACYPPFSAYLCGRSVVSGLRAECFIKNSAACPWAETGPKEMKIYEETSPVLWLRPGRAYRVIGGNL